MRKSDTVWNFPEEYEPEGTVDFRFVTALSYDGVRVPQMGTLVRQVATHPWFVILWEPLTTKVPGPHLAQPYCCYVRTVIFYRQPMQENRFIRPYCLSGRWGYSRRRTVYEEWAELETVFRQDDIIELNGTHYQIGSGRVIWYNNRWWMRHWARRKENL